MSATVSHLRPTSTSWVPLAACGDAEVPVDLFFDPDQQVHALTICRRCPVREQCLASEIAEMISINVTADEMFGVRGGLTAEQRIPLVAAARAEQCSTLVDDVGLTVAEQADLLGISKRTLQRRRAALRCAA